MPSDSQHGDDLCDVLRGHLTGHMRPVSRDPWCPEQLPEITSGGRDLECVHAPVDVVDVLLGSQVMGQRDAKFGSP